MMTASAILHIGLGKCGSSAIQQVLSARPEFMGFDGKRYAYIAINRHGRIIGSRGLQKNAIRSPFQYVASADAKTLLAFDERILRRLKQGLRSYSERRITPILSNEGWSRFGAEFIERAVFQSLGIAPRVVIYVRPQVAWLNSAWWQWGAWTRVPFEKWVEQQVPHLDWWSVIEPWLNSSGIADVSVRLLPSDVTEDFFLHLPAEPPRAGRTNAGLSSTVLRLMQRHPELRPNAHSSALAFILERRLADIPHSGSPWVIDQAIAERIIETCHAGNLKLLDALGEDGRQAMLDDPRWWDKSVYARKPVEPPGPIPVEPKEIEGLAVAMMRALEGADADLRAIRDGSSKARNRFLEKIITHIRGQRR